MSLHPAPDDDGDWIAALRGRPPAGAAPHTLDEAARIRAALRRQPPAEGEAESGLDALLFRRRREGKTDYYHRQELVAVFARAAGLDQLSTTLAAQLMEENRPFRSRWMKVMEAGI